MTSAKTPTGPSLLDLPNELLHQIAEHLPLSALAGWYYASSRPRGIVYRPLITTREAPSSPSSPKPATLTRTLKYPYSAYRTAVLYAACTSSHARILRDLVTTRAFNNHNTPLSPNNTLSTPLGAAMQNRHPIALRTLINAGASLHKFFSILEPAPTLLHTAVLADLLGAVKYICEARGRRGPRLLAPPELGGVDWRVGPELEGATAILLAAQLGSLRIVQYLIAQGARIDSAYADDNGRTPLWWAAWHGHVDVVQFFVDHLRARTGEQGDDVNRPLHIDDADFWDCTALRAAVLGGAMWRSRGFWLGVGRMGGGALRGQ
ncbi:ankyrin repeat-containing domain protein [Aspergillus multicolor]|uniref:ankyrin repeat domain-containing protein n=1 Tax=Aspergillus multicolor TaxID=41759 RepID=UPI003CCE523B